MKSSPENLTEHIKNLIDGEDLEGLRQTFSYWYYELACGKIKDPEILVKELLEALYQAQKIDPAEYFYVERAQCYEYLAGLKSNPVESLALLQHAAEEYSSAIRIQASPENKAALAKVGLNKIQAGRQYTDDKFREVLILFRNALTTWSEAALSICLHSTFDILRFPFDKREQWHQTFLEQLSSSLSRFVEKEPLVCLAWSEELFRIVDSNHYPLAPTYREYINQFAIRILENLREYPTSNSRTLNRLGSAFEKAAHRMQPGASTEAGRYYQIALHYFTQGQALEPAAWTFPVYATNVLKAMARLGQPTRHTLIGIYETGREIFAQVVEPGKDFTLSLYWGEFLLDYARQAYHFQESDLLREAAQKLTLAKELGQDHYDQPYLLLAKIALLSGDKARCLDLLRECKTIFSTPYTTYSLNKVLEDEEFSNILAEVRSL